MLVRVRLGYVCFTHGTVTMQVPQRSSANREVVLLTVVAQ
jgi:hypothetical protein